MKSLLVIVPLKYHTPFSRFYSISLASKLRHLQKNYGSNIGVLAPSFMLNTLPLKNCQDLTSWEELRNLAQNVDLCHKEDLSEFFHFTEQVVSVLEKDPLSTIEGVSIPRTLSYAFSAPHIEDLPFLITGIQRLLDLKQIDQIFLFGTSNFHETLLADIAISTNRKVRKLSSLPITAFQWSERVLNGLARPFQIVARLARLGILNWATLNPLAPQDIVILCNSRRGPRYMGPLIQSFNTMAQLSPQILGVAMSGAKISLMNKLGRLATTARLYFKLHAVWMRRCDLLAQIETRYKNVSISRYYLDELEKIWHSRGVKSAFVAAISQSLFDSSRNKALILIDPLEGSQVLSQRAREKGIPALLYMGQYSGSTAVATLWESNAAGIANVITTLNSWMRDRIIQKKIAPASQVFTVGDLLSFAPTPADKKNTKDRVYKKLGLDKAKKSVLLLSRHISAALTYDQKKGLIKSTHDACALLGIQLIIKTHPFEKQADLLLEMERWGCKGTVVTDEWALIELAMICDAVITYPASSSVLECIYARTPVILVGANGDFERLDQNDGSHAYRRYGAALCLTEYGQLSSELQKIIENPEARQSRIAKSLEFAERVFGPPDGKVADRIVQIILRLAFPNGQENREPG